MEIKPSNAGNITLRMLQDAYVKAMEVCPPDRFAGWSLLTGPGFTSTLPLEVIQNGILNASLDIIESPYCTKRIQFRFPRSKKRRIRRKWAKQERNFKIVPTAFWVDMRKLSRIEFPGSNPDLPRYFSY